MEWVSGRDVIAGYEFKDTSIRINTFKWRIVHISRGMQTFSSDDFDAIVLARDWTELANV